MNADCLAESRRLGGCTHRLEGHRGGVLRRQRRPQPLARRRALLAEAVQHLPPRPGWSQVSRDSRHPHIRNPLAQPTTRVAHRPSAYKYRVSPLKVALRPSLTIKPPVTLSIQTSRLAIEGRPEAVAHHEVPRHPRPAGSVPLERYVHPVQPARPGPAPDGLRVVAQEGVGGGGGGDRGTGLERRASLIYYTWIYT